MDELFKILFSNPIFIVIIIGVLLRLFKAKTQNKAEDSEADTSGQPAKKGVFQEVKQQIEEQFQEYTEPSSSNTERRTTRNHTQSQNKQRSESRQQLTAEEQREKQMARLKQNYQTEQKDVDDKHSGMPDSKLKDLQRKSNHGNNESGNVSLNKKLTKKGLAESVVMAEVLGPPRALKPYQNTTMNRYK